jgi:hypothetical protein
MIRFSTLIVTSVTSCMGGGGLDLANLLCLLAYTFPKGTVPIHSFNKL